MRCPPPTGDGDAARTDVQPVVEGAQDEAVGVARRRSEEHDRRPLQSDSRCAGSTARLTLACQGV